jgi:hypothetical protein
LETIRVFDLSRLDSLDLKKQYPDAQITFEPGATKDPQHGELATAALIALTVAGLNVLASWLLKNRKRSKIEKTIEIISPDGSRRTETIVMEVSESTSHADVVKALAPNISVDLSQLQGSQS